MRFLIGTCLNALLVAYASILAGHLESVPSTATLPPVSLLLNQMDAPLEILEYSASYKGSTIGDSKGAIEHQVTCQNVGDRNIVAIEITFLTFDIWNELLDRTNHTFVQSLKSDGECQLDWSAPLGASVDGTIFQTGVAYASRLRFEDGEIWHADVSEIAAVLVKIAPNISPSSL